MNVSESHDSAIITMYILPGTFWNIRKYKPLKINAHFLHPLPKWNNLEHFSGTHAWLNNIYEGCVYL